MAEKERARSIPPYVPWRTFENYLDGLKSFGPTLPNVIDRDSMRSYSGAMQSWLLVALRSLNMIDDDGVPRPRLGQIVHADADARKPLFRSLIEAEYVFLKPINLAGATPKQLQAAFESTGATGDTVFKCMAFFIGLAKAADIPLSTLILKVRRPARERANGGRQRAGRADPEVGNGNTPTPFDPVKPLQQKPTYQVLFELLSPDMDQDEQAAIWTLIRYLKKKEAVT